MDLDRLFEEKGIVGNGLTLGNAHLKWAQVKLNKQSLQVVRLEEVPWTPEAPKPSFPFDKKTPFATSIGEKGLCIKKIFSPIMPKPELAQTFKWQVLEEMQESSSELEVRFEKLNEENEEGLSAFMICALPPRYIEEARNKYAKHPFKIVALEPIGNSLSGLMKILDPESSKIRGIFYKGEKSAVFLGMKGAELYFCKSIPLFFEDTGEARTDWIMDFQQANDEFFVQEKINSLEEGLVIGEWNEEEYTSLAAMGLNLKNIEEMESPYLIFENPELKKRFSSFVLEIALALFPKALI